MRYWILLIALNVFIGCSEKPERPVPYRYNGDKQQSQNDGGYI